MSSIYSKEALRHSLSLRNYAGTLTTYTMPLCIVCDCVRQSFFAGTVLTYETVNKKFIQEKQVDYYSLPTKISQQIQRIVSSAWKGYFGAIRDYKKHPSKYLGKPQIPRYKAKGGFCVVPFTKQSIAFKNKNVPDGFLRLSGTSILIKTK